MPGFVKSGFGVSLPVAASLELSHELRNAAVLESHELCCSAGVSGLSKRCVLACSSLLL